MNFNDEHIGHFRASLPVRGRYLRSPLSGPTPPQGASAPGWRDRREANGRRAVRGARRSGQPVSRSRPTVARRRSTTRISASSPSSSPSKVCTSCQAATSPPSTGPRPCRFARARNRTQDASEAIRIALPTSSPRAQTLAIPTTEARGHADFHVRRRLTNSRPRASRSRCGTGGRSTSIIRPISLDYVGGTVGHDRGWFTCVECGG